MLTLHIDGHELDADALLAVVGFAGARLYRRGEPRSSLRPDGPKHDSSGLVLRVSDAELEEVERQIADGERFLATYADQMRAVRAFTGVESLTFDFGFVWKSTITHTDRFPGTLIAAMGRFGIDLHVSHYPLDGDPHEAGP